MERLGHDGPQGIAPEGTHVSIPGEVRGCDYWNVDVECGMWVLEGGNWDVGAWECGGMICCCKREIIIKQ